MAPLVVQDGWLGAEWLAGLGLRYGNYSAAFSRRWPRVAWSDHNAADDERKACRVIAVRSLEA